MKLSKIAILALKGMGLDVKEKIAQAAGVLPGTVYGWINHNKPNNDLTKASIVKIIADETGLTQEQILEESEVVQDSKA